MRKLLQNALQLSQMSRMHNKNKINKYDKITDYILQKVDRIVKNNN